MKKYLFAFAAILLNAILFYSLLCSGGTLQSRDVFGTEYVYTTADTTTRAGYIEGYPAYVLGIADNAGELLEFPVYQAKGWLRNNIIKTQKDFYGLEQVVLTPVSEAGFMSLLNYRITDLIALCLSLVTAFLLAPAGELSGRKQAAVPVLVWFVSISGMYLLNTALASLFLGLPEFGVSLQSLPPFQSCPYLISCGALLLLCFAFRLAGFGILVCMVLLLLTCRKRWTGLIPPAILGAELCLAFLKRPGMPELLRELNLFSAFGAERFFLRYLNLNLAGQAVSPLIPFTAFLILFAVITLFVTIRCVSSYTREITERTERAYYDELDLRYEETRKIRHDINNHLLALRLLVEQGDLANAKAYIGEISEELDRTILPVRTGSNVLDALLCQKLKQAQSRHMDIRTEIHCSVAGRNISDYDLCGIFGNILDNAMEAAAGTEAPVIRLFIGNQLDMLYISCENPYPGELKRRGDKFLTTKDSPEHHGFGIARVQEIAKTYEGGVNISTENQTFLIEILLNKK